MVEYFAEINRAMSGEFYFLIKSKKNKKVIATSEMYKTKASCVKTATKVAGCLGTCLEYSDEFKKNAK